MAALAEAKLSLEEFRSRFGGEKPYYEYWDGEAVQKSMPTWLHSVFQLTLGQLLYELGLKSASELTLRLSSKYEPVPDVVGMVGPITESYPTKAFEIVVEILSPDDPFSRVLRKCKLYESWGIRQIVVIDPQTWVVWRFSDGVPQESNIVATNGSRILTAETLWAEVDRRL